MLMMIMMIWCDIKHRSHSDVKLLLQFVEADSVSLITIIYLFIHLFLSAVVYLQLKILTEILRYRG